MTTCCNNYFFICNELKNGDINYLKRDKDKDKNIHNLSMIKYKKDEEKLRDNPPYLTFGDDDNTQKKEDLISTGFRIELNPDNTFNFIV